jgi:hypothetical protein
MLNSYQSSFFYGIPLPFEIQRIIETPETYIKEQPFLPLFGISFDGVFAKPGYDYNFHTQQVLGGSVAYPIADFITLSKKQVLINSGREILQFYLQSLDGDYVEPVAQIVIPYGKPAFFVLDFLKKIVDSYATALIKIVASFSDGDVFTPDEESMMGAWNQSVRNHPWFHIYDISHAIQNARRAFLKRDLLLPGSAVSINMTKLLAVCCKYPKLNKILPTDACLAKDKMSMELCTHVFNKEIITVLKSIHGEDPSSQEE